MKRWTANNKTSMSRLASCVDDSSQVIMSYNIHNPQTDRKVHFTFDLYNNDDFLLTLLNTEIEPLDTLFIDTKIVMLRGDYIKVTAQMELHLLISGA